MRKLIIGCGYLGRRVAAAWREQGDTVAALTRSPEHAAELRATGIEPLLGDVTRPESLDSLPEAETVLYAVGFDRAAGKSMREVYVGGLGNVLERLAGKVRRFLYVSSTSVYGQNAGEWVDEDSPCEPARENGVVCREAETLVQDSFRPLEAGGGRANVLRLAGIYGPGRMLRRVESVQSGEPLAGNPEAFLNLIHVDDAVQAVLACEERGQPTRTYLVADGEPLTRREYYTLLAGLLGAPAPAFAESGENVRMGPGLNKRCRNRRLREELQVELEYPTAAEGLPQALSGR